MIIGVLGGIGPESTAIFYQKLITELQKKRLVRSNIDYPNIIINSIPAPELLQVNGSNKGITTYLDGVRRLEKNNVDFIVMICNTIHIYYEYLSKKCGSRILNIRPYVYKTLKNMKSKGYCVLGTKLTITKGLYDFDGFIKYTLEPQEIGVMEEIIGKTNISFQERTRSIKKIQHIIDKYYGLGCDTFIMGCTEIALLVAENKIKKIDTLDVLVNMTIQEFQNTKKKTSYLRN